MRNKRGAKKRRRAAAPSHPAAQHAPPAPGDRALILVVAVYVAALVAMVAFNRYVFLLKSLVLPGLLLAALLSGRFKRFASDWAVFLGAVVFADFCRGLVFALTTHFERPMYLGYVLAWERWLCLGTVAPVGLQRLRASLSNPAWLDTFFVLVYSSHFVFFLLFGFAVWYFRRAAFRMYAIALATVMYAGVVCFFFVPTIPPWAAANEFLVLPPIVQIVRTFYNVRLPQLVAAFDVNPIAAMPSLHAALPAMCALLALRIWGRRGLAVLAYAAVVWLTVIYLGEHFLVDVVAGVALALVVYAVVDRWVTTFDGAAPSRAVEPQDRWEVRPIAIALVLVAAAVGFGQLSARWVGPLPITRAFVDRELMGRSRLAHYYLGRLAFSDGDFKDAQDELTRALDDLPHPAQQKVIRSFLGLSASHTGDLPAVIAALEPLRATADDVSNLVVLGNAYVDSDQYDKGLAVLRDARRRFPGAPEPLYWLTRYQYIKGDVDRDQVQHTIEALTQYPRDKAEPLRRSLAEVLQDGHLAVRR
jgi:tetratricopeptide (TPR) repeat protein